MTASKVRRWHLAAPPLYLILIAGLLYLQFGGLRQETRTVGEMQVRTSTIRDLLGRDRVRDVTVGYGGLKIALGAGGSLTLRDETGTVERLRPTGTQVTGSELVVIMGDRLELHFMSDAAGLSVHARPLQKLSFAVELRLPLGIDTHGLVHPVPGLPLVWTRSDGCTLVVSGDEGSVMDTRHTTRTLEAETRSLILHAELCTRVEDPYEYWFGLDGPTAGPEIYTAALADFLQRSYPAWQTRVYGEGTDLVAQDRLVVSYLSEALARGTFSANQAYLQARVLAQLADSQPSSMLPATYLGILPLYLAAGEERAAAAIQEVAAGIAREDPGVFSVPELLSTVLNHGATTVVDQLLALGASLDLSSLEVGALLGLARFYVDVEDMLGQMEGVHRRLEDIVLAKIIPAIRRTLEGIYLLADPGDGDRIERTLAAAGLLHDAATILDRPSLAAVGRKLALSVLALASGDGSVPAGVRIVNGRLVRSAETLASEAVYSILAHGRLPRQRPLPAELGGAAWVLTAADLRDVVVEPGSLRLGIGFPVAQTHYLVLQGVPAIQGLALHGLPWRADPEYYRYSDGWWYVPETRTLFIKCTQQRPWEELAVRFS